MVAVRRRPYGLSMMSSRAEIASQVLYVGSIPSGGAIMRNCQCVNPGPRGIHA